MEKKINDFIVFCIEIFKEENKLTGKEVYELFEKYGVLKYLYEGYVLKCDVKKYFQNIDHTILFNKLKKEKFDEDYINNRLNAFNAHICHSNAKSLYRK